MIHKWFTLFANKVFKSKVKNESEPTNELSKNLVMKTMTVKIVFIP